ncbi:hypothetical protein WJX73_008991 [Symbiochloris irregularis]|uniref:Uncharacterized protein n=1 Tax=Symbiochloris irregularis TaxID=706552 RepID=A0AAW1PMN0_9CHLO
MAVKKLAESCPPAPPPAKTEKSTGRITSQPLKQAHSLQILPGPSCQRHRHRLPYPREIQTSDDKHVPYRWGKKLHDCEEMEDASDDYMEEMRSPHAFKGMETRCEGLGLLESLQQLAPHLTPDPPRKWPPSLLIERRLWDSATPEDQGQALQQLRQLGLTSAVLDPA